MKKEYSIKKTTYVIFNNTTGRPKEKYISFSIHLNKFEIIYRIYVYDDSYEYDVKCH